MTQEIRLSLIQDNPVTGDVLGNAQRVLAHMEAEKSADLIVFSECFLTGYPVQDLVLRPGFLRAIDDQVAAIRQRVMEMNGPAILLGAPQTGTTLPYNAAFLIEPSGDMRVVHKAELPNTDVFDERRTFAMADAAQSKPMMFRGFNLGVQICEDMWHGPVSRALADEGAEILLVINGSPYQNGKQAIRLNQARARIRATGLPLIYVNQVGGQDELVFDGRSFTLNLDGALMTAPAFRAATLRAVLRRQADGSVHIEGSEENFAEDPFAKDGPEAEDYAACVVGLRDYMAKTGSRRVFIGVSGGLDSAIVLAMAADALGAENVVGVMMPSEHTGGESLALAEDLMTRLGVHKRTLPIKGAYETVDAALTPFADDLAAELGVEANHGIARENYQARLRGLKLMGLSNALGGIVLSTGNKSEMAVGYATLYGDMAGGFNPLKSVYKSEAFRMARWRNACDAAAHGLLGAQNPIPERIIDRPPTAELAEGQTDEASLGSYDVLDCVLRAMIEGRMDPVAASRHAVKTFGHDEVVKMTGGKEPQDYAEGIARKIRNAQYKRVQAPPGVKLNETDFGQGWRYPVAGKYEL